MNRDEVMQELRQLLSTDEVGTAAILKEMGLGNKPRAEHKAPSVGSPVKHLTQIVRTYTCFTCGSRWTRTIQIADTETLCGVDRHTGNIVCADAKHGPYTIDSWTHSCNKCDGYIAQLPRDVLEQLYKEARMFTPFPKEDK